MLRVHVIYQWRTPVLTRRILEPFEQLKRERRFEVSFFSANQYVPKELAKADALLLAGVSERPVLDIVEEARQRGIRVIYDDGFSSIPDATGSKDYSEARESAGDVRTLAMQAELRRRADLITVLDSTACEGLKRLGFGASVIAGADANTWHDTVSELIGAPRRQQEAVCGKKIFFLAPTFMWPHHYISDMLVRSLIDLGHTVHLFTLKPSRFHDEAICMTREFNSGFITSVAAHCEEGWKIPLLIDREGPDLVLTVQGYVIPRQILEEIHRRSIPTAAWFMDEPYDATRSCSFGRYYSHVFLQDKSSVDYHRRHGNPNTFYLPHGCDPTVVHAVQPQESREYLRDVALVGNPFPHREQLIGTLLQRGISVEAAGNGWLDYLTSPTGSRLPLLQTCPTLSLADAASYYRQTRINLNQHRHEDDFSTNPGMFRAGSPNCSAFYIAGSGGFQLADSGRPELSEFFVADEEIVLFDSPSDCADKIRYYLDHNEERQLIADRGRERAVRDHSYSRRLEKMLTVIDTHESVSSDCGHRAIGYVRFSDTETLPEFSLEDSNLTLLCSSPPAGLPGWVRTIVTPNGKGFAAAMNAAAFESASDYLVVGSPGLNGQSQRIEQLLSAFHKDLYSAMLLFHGEGGKDITGFAMPVRTLLEAGLFRYGNASLCIQDMAYRLMDMGQTVTDAVLAGPALDDSEFSLVPSEEDLREFGKEWTSRPEDRLLAQRLMSNSTENALKLNNEEAKRFIYESLEICPGFLRSKRQLAGMLLKDGSIREAQKQLNEIRDIDPLDFQSAFLYATSLYMSKQDDQSLQVLDELHRTDLSPVEQASAHYLSGLIMKRKLEPGMARKHLMSALEADPRHSNALKELSLIALEDNQPGEALVFMKRRLQIAENDETLNDIGVICWQAGFKEDAFLWFSKALEKNPASREAVGNLANAGSELGRLSEVTPFIQKALLHFPNDKELSELSAMAGRAK